MTVCDLNFQSGLAFRPNLLPLTLMVFSKFPIELKNAIFDELALFNDKE